MAMFTVEGAVSAPHHQRLPPAPAFAHLPPVVVHTYEFLQHFVLFFLVPIAATAFCAIFAAALAKWIYRVLFAPYATPKELMDYAVTQLKKNEGKSRNNRTTSVRRDRALNALRLLIRLNERSDNGHSDHSIISEKVEPYVVLATELFYGEMNEPCRARRKEHGNSLRRRGIQQLRTPTILSPGLVECQEIITKGLRLDPKNEPLLKLQSELQLFLRDGSNAKMMNVGSFGWMSG